MTNPRAQELTSLPVESGTRDQIHRPYGASCSVSAGERVGGGRIAVAQELRAAERLVRLADVVGGQEALRCAATVELSAYRIVEHLVTALADQADSPIHVAVRFEDDALEIRVNGPVDKGTDMKAAIARAKERAKLLGSSVYVKVARSQAGAVAHLPVLG